MAFYIPAVAVQFSADCVLCTAYCVLYTAYCVLRTAYCVLCTVYCVRKRRSLRDRLSLRSRADYECVVFLRKGIHEGCAVRTGSSSFNE